MFLNKLGIPFIVKHHECNISAQFDEDLRHAPLLLSNSSEIMHCKIPPGWDGCLYASAATFEQIRKNFNFRLPQLIDTCELTANVPTMVKLYRNVENKVELTLIQVSEKCANAVMFLIKDAYTTRLLTERLNNCWDAFLYNRPLREAISAGVDVLYLDDTVFLEHEQAIPVDVVYPKKFELLTLMYLVRPKEVVGITGSDVLPEHILKMCHSVNLYSDSGLEM